MPRQRLPKGPAAVVVVLLVLAAIVLAGRAWGVAAALLTLSLAGLAMALRRGARAQRALDVARRRTEQLERFLGSSRITPAAPMRAVGSDRRDVTAVSNAAPPEAVEAILRIARDQAGADEAVFFRITREQDALVAVAWASEGTPAPVGFRDDWHGLVEWTARERLPQCDASFGPVAFAAAPVPGERAPLGTICVYGSGALAMGREALLAWLPRHASVLGNTVELIDARRRLSDASRRAELVLRNVEEFQTKRTPAELGELICQAALQVSGGDEAVLVRWHRGEIRYEDRGEVASASAADVAATGLAVDKESLVGEICRGGLPQVWENALPTTAARHLFSEGDSSPRVASLGIYPLKNRDRRTVGAIVVIGRRVGAIRYPAMRDLRMLSFGAAMSLETVWEIEDVSRRATTDALTGLRNRRAFDDQLAREQALVDRSQSGVVSLVIADIDFFKRVNDTHGHDAGDAVLRAVAKVFQECARETDLCARFGGEELAVLLPGTAMEGAMEVAERLRRAIEERPVKFAGKEIAVTASFGVASYPHCAGAREAFFSAADKALYEAKRDGRNRVKCAPLAISRKTT